MKQKRRKGTDVPSNVRSFIDNVISVPLEEIELPLLEFSWEFEKGDFNHWVDLFNHFDSFFDKYVNQRKDLNLEGDEFLVDSDPPFPRDPVLQILRVSRIILENCSNRHLYTSFTHLATLLASTDADIMESTLQTLMAFTNKSGGGTSTKTPFARTASLTSKLFSLSQGWGGKEGGLGLISSCLPEPGQNGSTFHFEFYSSSPNGSNGLKTIHLPNTHLIPYTDFDLFSRLVKEQDVPPHLRFSLLTRLRFARAFGLLENRYRFVCVRLYAFILLVQAGRDSEDVMAFFANEPEFVDELLSVLSFHEEVPEKVRVLAILSLVALCHDRSQQPVILSALSNGSHRTILPTILQKSIDSLQSINFPAKCSVIFAEALLSLVSLLVSSTQGSLALQEAGILPTVLPLLKDFGSQHLHLVKTAVHVIEGLLDYHPPSSALFRDLGGLDESISRLNGEVSEVESYSFSTQRASTSRKGKELMTLIQVLQPVDSVLLHNRRALIKALLRVISLATYVPGTAARVSGTVETVLPFSLAAIFKRGKEFGGGVFSLAAHVLTDLVHKDPTCFPALEQAGLPSAFIDAITNGLGPLCSGDVATCIPPCLDALCLNNNGLNLVKERNALKCFVKIFTSKSYLKALSSETASGVSSGLDELLRHVSVLRPCGVETVIEMLDSVAKTGTGSMETDESDRNQDQISDLDSVVPDLISNIVRLLEPIVQNLDTCRMFIERKGVEAVLRLFELESVPVSVSIGQTVSAAFKNFSPTQSVSLVRTVRSFVRDRLSDLSRLLGSVSGLKLPDVQTGKLQPVLKALSSTEGLLVLMNFLLKNNTVMITELAVSEAEILNELAKVYVEITWQASLLADSKSDEKVDGTEETGTGMSQDDEMVPTSRVERESEGERLPDLTRTDIDSDSWRAGTGTLGTELDQDFASVVRSAMSPHRHGRLSSLARLRGGSRLIRHLDAFHSRSDEPDASNSALEISSGSDTGGKKGSQSLLPEVLSKMSSTIRSLLIMIVKSLPARRRTETTLSSASRSVLTALSQLFLSALNFTGTDSSLSVKCRYLGKVSDDMSALTFDSRRRACYSSTVNGFYTNGTFKELLTTFEATSQLLWTLPISPRTEQKSPEYPSWLLETLQSYCKLLECYVNSSYLLSPSAPQSVQLLVQPVTTDLSINLFPLPRDPKGLVRTLQTQVLEVVLPVWNHPLLPNCPQIIIAPLISIMDHICSEIGEFKPTGQSGGGNPRMGIIPPIEETTVTTIVEMGFSRARAEEALRNVGSNSVELATDWLFSHPEEIVQEDLQFAQALALSLGTNNNSNNSNSNEVAKEESPAGDVAAPVLPLDDILSVAAKLFRNNDLVAFALNDLLVTLCNRNKGEDRNKVVEYLVQQLKLCPVGPGSDASTVYPVAHMLALLLNVDCETRGIAARNGVIPAVLNVLNLFLSGQKTGGNGNTSVENATSTLLLILDSMLQQKPVKNAEPSSDPPSSDTSEKEKEKEVKSIEDLFGTVLGKPTGFLTEEESQRVLTISCELVKQQAPAPVMQACLQLVARLTKIHSLSTKFIDSGGLSALFNLPTSSVFPGFESLASVIVRHLAEDPQTLQSAMELEIKQALNVSGSLTRHGSRVSTRSFLTSMAPVISRDPIVFMKAAASVCQLDLSSGGRMNVVLFKESKEKEKDKGRVHKRVPASLSHVIDRLLEIVLNYEPKFEECTAGGSTDAIPMEIDETSNNKGKSIVDDVAEKPSAARVSLVLKLLSEILLMYSHTVLVLLKRDSEMMQMRGTLGIVHHLLHNLMPLSNKKAPGVPSGDDSHAKLSEKASFFLVVLCGRSTEGRRRVISEITRALSSFLAKSNSSNAGSSSSSSTGMSNGESGTLVPDRRVWSLCYLVYLILSRNSGSSSSLPGLNCSPDMARAMIEGAMIQSLSSLLKYIDLDHPDALRVCNLILKSLESLTRAANSTEQVVKQDGSVKPQNAQSLHAAGLSIREPDSTGTGTGTVGTAEEREAERERIESQEEQDRVSEEEPGLDRGEEETENPREESEEEDDADEDEDEDADEDDDDVDDRDDDVSAADRGARMIPLANTESLEDEEDEEEYDEEMIEEEEEDEDDDVAPNRFIEVRWQGGIGLENLRVSRGRGFIEIASESFQAGGDETDELYNLHRSMFGSERRRQPGGAARSSGSTSRPSQTGFQHPLIVRPARDPQPVVRETGVFNPVTQYYMLENGIPTESGSLFGSDQLVGSNGGGPSQLIDFSLGMEGLRTGGRRGSRWTDDGQPQASAQAASIAQAVEDRFISEIPAVPVQVPVSNSSNPNPNAVSNDNAGNPNPSDATNPDNPVENPDEEPALLPLGHADVEMQQNIDSLLLVNNDEDLPDAELAVGEEQADDPNRDAHMSDMDSCHAVISSNPPAAAELSDARASSDADIAATVSTENDADVNNNNNTEAENPVQEQENPVVSELAETEAVNEIDPTFLEALPEDLRAEVLASQQNRPAGGSGAGQPEPPAGGSGADVAGEEAEAEEIDPEFLAALPPDIQAEVLAQQRAQRLARSRQPARQPTDMDNASIIATFPPEIREEVLLTSSEAVLSGLPSSLLAEAQLLRDRELSRYRSRGSLFGGSHHRPAGAARRFAQSVMDRGVGVSLVRHVGTGREEGVGRGKDKDKDKEGVPVFDREGLGALVRLFQLAQPLSKGILQRLMLNLCAHSVTRRILIGLLVDMIRPEADGPDGPRLVGSCRLYGRKYNVVYAPPQSPNGLPPLVSRRLLENLTYLASSHASVADILSLSEPSESVEKSTVEPKGKAVISDEPETPVQPKDDSPLLLFLKLLRVPLFLRSRVHLEQVMSLLEVVVNNAVAKVEIPTESDNPLEPTQPGGAAPAQPTEPEQAFSLNEPKPAEPLSAKQSENLYSILAGLPESELGNLCNVLSLEGLPSKVYSLAAEVVKKLASIAAIHRKFFSSQLATLARSLSHSAVAELASLRTNQTIGFSSMTGTAILRVLQALCTLSSESEKTDENQNPILFDLNTSLEPLWQELSECISLTESKIGQSQPGTDETSTGSTTQPLPPGTQRLLPFIESFFVLCEKLQSNPSIFQLEIPASPQRENTVTFARVAEKHRRLLNVFIRQNPNLLEKSLSMMLKIPRLIDFDNKRAYFRSKIRSQNDNHLSGPIRISVRRAYILEDSYNQLRLRRYQDLKGRLTVQFQGEEGIDAGGLTREWYQLLSRVIFDKGALLFTTVGNNASFQPNPNSVYQTEHLSYFKFVGRVVAKALFDGQLLDVHFTRSFYKHMLGVKVTYHDIEAVDPDYYKNLKWMLENDVSEIPDLTFSMDADEEKHILYEKTEVTDYELKPGGRNLRVTEESKHEYVDLVANHILTNAIRPQINAFLEGFTELIPRDLISIFNDKELELLISGLPEIDLDDLRANAEYIGYTPASPVVQWFWEVVKGFSKEDMARLLQFVTGTSKVPLEGFKALQGISGAQRFQIHKAYGAPERLPSAHTCFNQLDLPEYNTKEQLEERLLLAIHEASEGFGFG